MDQCMTITRSNTMNLSIALQNFLVSLCNLSFPPPPPRTPPHLFHFLAIQWVAFSYDRLHLLGVFFLFLINGIIKYILIFRLLSFSIIILQFIYVFLYNNSFPLLLIVFRFKDTPRFFLFIHVLLGI